MAECHVMKRTLPLLALAALALGGCVVPAPPPRPPIGVVYVRPAYAIPGPGYEWRYHPRYGWGYWHPHYGWHYGWR